LQWNFGKIESTKGSFRTWGDWEVLELNSIKDIDLSSKKALKKQAKLLYREFKRKLRRE
jgi:hypothetical protein